MANQVQSNDAGRWAAQEAARRAAEEAARRAAEEAARRAAEAAAAAAKSFGKSTFTPAQPKGPDLKGGASAGSSLVTEDIHDSQVNCLDRVGDKLAADPALRANSQVVFLRDTRPGAEGDTGHVVLQQGNQIWDPATEKWTPTAQYLRQHPEYDVAGTASGQDVHDILSADPGAERDTAIANASIDPELISMNVADPRNAGRGGNGNPYNDSDEFEHALHSSYDRFGPIRTGQLQTVIDQVHNGQQPALSTALPQAGDVMVWSPNAGNGSVGLADGAGHVGVIESVTVHGNTVTLRVSEQNWDNQDGTTNGVPYRDIDLPLNADGTVTLPNGVGFVPLNNPPIGRNPPIHKDGFQIDRTPAHDPQRSYANASGTNPLNNYTGCVGYIHDMPQFGPLMEQLASTQPNNYLKGGNIPINSYQPEAGSLMIWGVGAGDANVGTSSGPDGHVAYVEDVQKNYDPPGDPNGRIVSYTITISEANGPNLGTDERGVRTFTVPARADGQPDLPANVGFYDPGTSSTAGTAPANGAPATGGSSSSGQPIARNSTYTVQQNDTLWSIATRAGVTVDQLVAANPSLAANPDLLSIGQQLRIP